jgi:TIR domain
VIFLSYARADAPLVDQLYEHLSSEVQEVWLDRRRLSASERWLASIAAAIDRADRVIVVASQYSGTSAHVRWEHERAVRMVKPVDVVLVDNCVPRLLGAPNERLHDFRIDPLDPAPWLDLARGSDAAVSAPERSASVLPAYVRASARAALPMMSLMAATAGAISITSSFSPEVSDEGPANPALFSLYIPGALVVWALQWEVRRVHGLRRRRLRANRNDVGLRVLRLALVVAGLIIVAYYWWAFVIVLLIAAGASMLKERRPTLLGHRLFRTLEPSDAREPLIKRLRNPIMGWSRSVLSNYHNSKVESWLPAFVERRASGFAAVDEASLRLHQAASADAPTNTVRSLALVFADPDAAVAARLASALRSPSVELVSLHGDGAARKLAAKHDAVVFVLSRFSQRALAEFDFAKPLVIVSYGPARVPGSLAHLQVLDMTNREVATVAEAVDETLATGRHSELMTTADRRSSLLGIPRAVGNFALAYVAVIGFLGFMLVNGVLEERDVAAIAVPVVLLSCTWLYLVLTRRAPLTLGLITTAVIAGIVGVEIARLAPSLNNFFVLVVPGLWIWHQYSEMQTGSRDIDAWAPKRSLDFMIPWIQRRGHRAA